MGSLTAGSVVLVRFPFSDLSQTKLRPAVVVADCGRGDWLLCQLTSNAYSDPLAIELRNMDFQSGSLRAISYARPGKLFTAHDSLISSQIGALTKESQQRISRAIAQLIQSGT